MRITIVGCGVMGSTFARHLSLHHTLTLYDRHVEKREALALEVGGRGGSDLVLALNGAELILLAIKPKDLQPLSQEMKGASLKGKVVISVLTGATLALLKSLFPDAEIARAMPNLGIAYGQGVTGIVQDPQLGAEARKRVESVLDGMGLTLWLAESRIDALIALSGSGIAFVLVMIESMIDGGIFLGFSSKEAREIVLETMRGAIALLEQSGAHPDELKQRISSPGGTTVAGLKAMEEAGVRAGILLTLNACYERAVEITSTMKR
jgi:pyrroline-5-carboxylate reductase